MDTMANSAGSAEAEMEKITQSLEYKLNTLGETWVGVAQNLFNTDSIGFVIDALTFFSNIIDNLTSSLGLLGTVGLATAIAGITKFTSTVGGPEMTGSMIVPTYAPVVTRNELAA